jgi:hypothetical protein
MATEQFKGSPEEADLSRADSLAREIFSDVANKWAFLIVEGLGDRTLRFSELRNEIEGISHKNARPEPAAHRGRPPSLRRLTSAANLDAQSGQLACSVTLIVTDVLSHRTVSGVQAEVAGHEAGVSRWSDARAGGGRVSGA